MSKSQLYSAFPGFGKLLPLILGVDGVLLDDGQLVSKLEAFMAQSVLTPGLARPHHISQG